MLLARTTRPLEAVTLCLVVVTLFMFSERVSRMIGVPTPGANDGLSIGVDFM